MACSRAEKGPNRLQASNYILKDSGQDIDKAFYKKYLVDDFDLVERRLRQAVLLLPHTCDANYHNHRLLQETIILPSEMRITSRQSRFLRRNRHQIK